MPGPGWNALNRPPSFRVIGTVIFIQDGDEVLGGFVGELSDGGREIVAKMMKL